MHRDPFAIATDPDAQHDVLSPSADGLKKERQSSCSLQGMQLGMIGGLTCSRFMEACKVRIRGQQLMTSYDVALDRPPLRDTTIDQ